mgnify:CR=1 FL=1
MIEVERLSFAYADAPVLRDVSFCTPDGAITALIGPNGSGKSTLLRAMARLLPITQGIVRVDGRAQAAYGQRSFARALAFLPQSRTVPAISVASLVAHGRFPHTGFSHKLSRADAAAVERALDATGLSAYAHRDLRTLSGGERQKAYLAMLIAQETQNLLLDEPTTYLDVAHQLELADILGSLRNAGRCVVVVLHDIGQALSLCDRVALIHEGRLRFIGTPSDPGVLPAVELAFGVRAIRREGISFERMS